MELIRQPKIENVRMLDRLAFVTIANAKSGSNAVSGTLGTLYLTPTHLIFVDHEGRNETWVLHSHLSSIDKLTISSLGAPLTIKCKNFQAITFILPKEKDAHEVWTSLYNLSQPLSYDDLYCFRFSASNESFQDNRSQGWNKFDLLQEFERQGVPNKEWVMTDLNKNYALCDTYPRFLFVPASATESMLKGSAGFRSKCRLPVLTYLHPKNGAVICRCSQPLSGFNSRCEEDESLLNCILRTKTDSKVLYVVDTRPRVSGLLTSLLLSSCHYYYSSQTSLLSWTAGAGVSARGENRSKYPFRGCDDEENDHNNMSGGNNDKKKSRGRNISSSSPASRCSSLSPPPLRPSTACTCCSSTETTNTNSSSAAAAASCESMYSSSTSSPSSPQSPASSSSCTQFLTKRRNRNRRRKRRRRRGQPSSRNEYDDENCNQCNKPVIKVCHRRRHRHHHRSYSHLDPSTLSASHSCSRSPSPALVTSAAGDATVSCPDDEENCQRGRNRKKIKSPPTVVISSFAKKFPPPSSLLSSVMMKLTSSSTIHAKKVTATAESPSHLHVSSYRSSPSLLLPSSASSSSKKSKSNKKMNAYANKAAGKGYENENFYENIKFNFFGIENIHVMRGSLNKLIEASEMFNLTSDAFISALEGSGWLKHIKSVLEAAAFVVRAVEDGISVVVHCSDGWDRTAQTCSLAAILLDPYYRTMTGFQALIEKEWLWFGHKFSERCGHIQGGESAKEVAPIFTQFVDCIWQITQQFPTEFEFNDKFLLMLHDHVYSCQFGTFIGNSDRERSIDQLNIQSRCYSLWAFMDSRRELLLNPLYFTKRKNVLGGSDNLAEKTLILDTSPQVIRFWSNFYNRFESGIHPRESVTDLMEVTYNHIVSLERHVKYLEMRLKEAELKKKKQAKLLKVQQQQELKQKQQQEHQLPPQSGSGPLLPENEVMDHLEPPAGTAKKLSDSSRTSSSFDSIDFPLKIVKQCMERLEIKQREDAERAKEMHQQDQWRDEGEEGEEVTATPATTTTTTSKLTSVESHPLDPSLSPAPPPLPARLARENLRLNDLKIMYPEGRTRTDEGRNDGSQQQQPSSRKDTLLRDMDEAELRKEIMSVAVDWESLRSSKECPCGFPFEATSARNHCYSCGRIHCVRCIDRKVLLPGHLVRKTLLGGTDEAEVSSSGSSDVFESPTNAVKLTSDTVIMSEETNQMVSVCRSCYRIILDKDSFNSPS